MKEKEKEKWLMLDFQYMTELSDQSDCVVEHPLPWRSEGNFQDWYLGLVPWILQFVWVSFGCG